MDESAPKTPSRGRVKPTTRLRSAAPLDLRIDSAGEVIITVGHEKVAAGHHTLAILDTFTRPLAFEEGLRQLEARAPGAHAWMSLSGAIVALARAGVLVDADHPMPELKERLGYGAARIHTAMLDDRARTSAFVEAVGRIVKPGDVVVDIGTGTGVLALAAARAGAKHVYAIEASAIGRAAKLLFEGNGFGDRITLVEGWATEVTLPVRADVMVSELIGDDPLCEEIIEITEDARRRYLLPGARSVPGSVSVYAVPVTLPEGEREQRQFTHTSLSRWSKWYGFDFSPLSTTLARDVDALSRYFKHSQATREWTRLGDPIHLTTLTLDRGGHAGAEGSLSSEVERGQWDREGVVEVAGVLDAFLVYFETDLAPGIRLSTHPARVDPDNHWLSPIWLFATPRRVEVGASLALSVQLAGDGGLRLTYRGH